MQVSTKFGHKELCEEDLCVQSDVYIVYFSDSYLI